MVVPCPLLCQVLVPFYLSQEACDNAACVQVPLLSHAPLPSATVAFYEISLLFLFLLNYIKEIAIKSIIILKILTLYYLSIKLLHIFIK